MERGGMDWKIHTAPIGITVMAQSFDHAGTDLEKKESWCDNILCGKMNDGREKKRKWSQR